jgi:membrane-associated protease RseP (regulator of RpoE activity)
MRRNSLYAIGSGILTIALLAPVAVRAQESKCNSCEAGERDGAVRRYQQDIERARREIESLERQLASAEATLDTATMRSLNERMQRAVTQLTRANIRQGAYLQAGANRRTPVIAVTPPPGQWTTHAIDGYIGVMWSARVDVETPKNGDALWTFRDYPQVEAVERDSPAERAGIEVGDMIQAFNGKDLRKGRIALNSVLRPGSAVTVRLTREERVRSVTVRVAERPRLARTPRAPLAVQPGEWTIEGPEVVVVPEVPSVSRTPLPPRSFGASGGLGMLSATAGAEMMPLDPTLGEPFGTEYGLWILRVGPSTPAARAGIQKGDVLISVDGRELHSVPALIRAMERAEKASKQELRIELLRKGERKVVAMRW